MRRTHFKFSGHYLFVLISITTALTGAGQTPLANGVPAQDSLSSPTAAKTWSFSANAGDRIILTVAKLSGGAAFNPLLKVVSPAGFPLGASSGVTAARLDLQ